MKFCLLFVTEEINASFRRFGSLVVDWPHKAESKSYFPPKGYAFLLFQVSFTSHAPATPSLDPPIHPLIHPSNPSTWSIHLIHLLILLLILLLIHLLIHSFNPSTWSIHLIHLLILLLIRLLIHLLIHPFNPSTDPSIWFSYFVLAGGAVGPEADWILHPGGG